LIEEDLKKVLFKKECDEKGILKDFFFITFTAQEDTTMVKKIELASGNTVWYKPEEGRVVSLLLVTSPSPGKKFLGGAAGQEADRKLRVFASFPKVKVVEVVSMPPFGSLDTSIFNEWVGSASGLMGSAERIIRDNDVSNYGYGVACDERRAYYHAVGLSRMYNSDLGAPLWAVIANHVTMFSREHFRETFFHGTDLESCGAEQHIRKEVANTRYSNRGFKSPAYYLRVALNHGSRRRW